jgi:hypothetical protein
MTTHSFRRMKELFEQIRISDLDTDLSQMFQGESGFQRLYLKLSGEPPPEWVKTFERKRRFPRHPIWRNAWVVGAHIVIDCSPEELEQFGLNHLKEDVADANSEFLESSARHEADNLRQFERKEATRKQLEELRAKLKFD